MRIIQKGATDQSVVLRALNAADGTPATSFDHATAGIDLWYRREGAVKVSITEAALAALDTAHTDGGVEYLGDGYFRLDPPDAAFATGANGVMFGGTATNIVIVGCYVHLVDFNPQDAVRLGITALPNAAPDAAGGLPISDAGGLDLDARLDAAVSSRATPAQVATELATYDGPTKAELDSAVAPLATQALLTTVAGYIDTEITTIINAIAAQNNLSAAQVRTELAVELARIDAAITTRATPAQVATELGTYDAPTKAELDTTQAAIIAAVPTAVQTADALLGRNIAGGSSTGRTVTSALRRLRNRVAIAAGTMTTYAEDDATPDHTAAVTTAAGDPITEVDPA